VALSEPSVRQYFRLEEARDDALSYAHPWKSLLVGAVEAGVSRDNAYCPE